MDIIKLWDSDVRSIRRDNIKLWESDVKKIPEGKYKTGKVVCRTILRDNIRVGK